MQVTAPTTMKTATIKRTTFRNEVGEWLDKTELFDESGLVKTVEGDAVDALIKELAPDYGVRYQTVSANFKICFLIGY